MKRLLATQTGLASVTVGLVCLLALPASVLAGQADRASAGGGSTGGGGGAVSSAGASGGSMSSSGGGGGGERAGAGGGFAGGGSSSDPGGNRAGATGGSGIAMPRGGDHGGGTSAPRHTAGGSSGFTSPRTGGRTQDSTGEREPSGVPRYSRPHDPNTPTVGTAVPRPPDSTPTVKGGGSTYIIPGGYYGGYFGGYGYGYGYSGGYYGGYYDPWYDPWYGGYPGYGGGYSQTYTSTDEGALRLKIKPRDAEVYVDGYFVGQVDEFDGLFQRLHIESGVHRVEVRAPGFETLTFEVRIVPDRKTTYQGEMHRIQ